MLLRERRHLPIVFDRLRPADVGRLCFLQRLLTAQARHALFGHHARHPVAQPFLLLHVLLEQPRKVLISIVPRARSTGQEQLSPVLVPSRQPNHRLRFQGAADPSAPRAMRLPEGKPPRSGRRICMRRAPIIVQTPGLARASSARASSVRYCGRMATPPAALN